MKCLCNLHSVPLSHRPKAVLATQEPPPPPGDTPICIPRGRLFVCGSWISPLTWVQLLPAAFPELFCLCRERLHREISPSMLQEEGPMILVQLRILKQPCDPASAPLCLNLEALPPTQERGRRHVPEAALWLVSNPYQQITKTEREEKRNKWTNHFDICGLNSPIKLYKMVERIKKI